MANYVKGDKETIALLQSIKKTKAKAAIRKGARAGCKLVQAQVKADVPVKSGVLRQSIKVRALKRSRRWTGVQVSTTPAQGGIFYGAFLEWGTKGKSGGVRIAARRYVLHAALKVKAGATSAFLDGIRQELEKSKS